MSEDLRFHNILITGGDGFVGRNLSAYLRDLGCSHVHAPSHADCDFTDRSNTNSLFAEIRPSYVFHLAGRVRGLGGNLNSQGAAYLENTLINTNVIDAAYMNGAMKIVAMGTIAMYPDPLPHNPLRETDLWLGKPHASEYGYAQAKRGMLAQLEAYNNNYGLRYAVALSTNLYGPHDRFNPLDGHVIPSLVRKFYQAAKNGKVVLVWGDGSAQRDFMYVKDCVRALAMLAEQVQGVINVATGLTYRIKDVVDTLDRHTDQKCRIVYDETKPGGQMVRGYDVSRLDECGFKTQVSLDSGIKETFDWYAANAATARR